MLNFAFERGNHTTHSYPKWSMEKLSLMVLLELLSIQKDSAKCTQKPVWMQFVVWIYPTSHGALELEIRSSGSLEFRIQTSGAQMCRLQVCNRRSLELHKHIGKYRICCKIAVARFAQFFFRNTKLLHLKLSSRCFLELRSDLKSPPKRLSSSP